MWTYFRQIFFDHIFPTLFRDAKAKGFASLDQGTMTVHHYGAKFVEM